LGVPGAAWAVLIPGPGAIPRAAASAATPEIRAAIAMPPPVMFVLFKTVVADSVRSIGKQPLFVTSTNSWKILYEEEQPGGRPWILRPVGARQVQREHAGDDQPTPGRGQLLDRRPAATLTAGVCAVLILRSDRR
jgi:hypothetical protein